MHKSLTTVDISGSWYDVLIHWYCLNIFFGSNIEFFLQKEKYQNPFYSVHSLLHDSGLSDWIEAMLLACGHDLFKGKRRAAACSLMWWLEIGLLAPFTHRQNGRSQRLLILMYVCECIPINAWYTFNGISRIWLYLPSSFF